MIRFASRVALFGARGYIRHVPAAYAKRIYLAPNVQRADRGRTVRELLLLDHNPMRDDAWGVSTNSLRAGYMQSLPGGELVRIDTLRESRTTTTGPCRVYKLKRIPEDMRPLYRLAVLDNLVTA